MLHFGMNMPFYLMALYGSIMIVMILILRLLLRNRLPKFVFPVLWGLVLLRFLVPFSISIPLSMPVPANPHGEHSTATTMIEEATVGSGANAEAGTVVIVEGRLSTSTEIPSDDASIARTVVNYGDSANSRAIPFITWEDNVIPMLYILGLFITAGILGWQKYGYVKKLQNSLLVEHNETINTILRGMDMGHVLVFTCDRTASPLACGLLNPRIYLPTQMDFQNMVLLRHVLVHEATHIRRRDNWMKAILLIVLGLNWYNPLVWLMAVCLVSDLEAACDAAVLKVCGEDERKEYASSLLSMALSGRRTTLLYSAFSKTEVEKRVKNILRYKRATAFVLLFTVLFMAGSVVVFAAVGQAPFQEDLTSYCASDSSRWGVRVTLTRDISLGERAKERAETVVFAVLRMDSTNDPRVIEDRIRASLAEEFGVEKGAFHVALQLSLCREELEEEYAAWGITQGKDGFWMYREEKIRTYEDRMLGSYQSRAEGTVDISVQRDAMGEITSVTTWRQGDSEFDGRTRRIEKYRGYLYDTQTEEDTVYKKRLELVQEAYQKLQEELEKLQEEVQSYKNYGNNRSSKDYSTARPEVGNTAVGLDDSDYRYEYYLTKEELISDIEQGYIFKVDTEFTKRVDAELTQFTAPYVSQGNWPFYVHEENTVNLEIAFSDLVTKPNKNIFPEDERIIVDVISPDGQSVYRFEKTGDEIMEDISVQEQISVIPGEWKLQVSFAYVCGESPARLKISAAYNTPSVDDINWLKEERLKSGSLRVR